MDLPATQAMDDEDFVPTQKMTGDQEPARSLIGTLIVNDDVQHQIFSGTTIIGRLPDCTIVLNDETVSKRHAEIEAESTERAIFIKDLGSSNKTKINDTKLRPNASYQIRDNDKLNFGKVTSTFKIHRPVEDSFVACTPQVNRRAVIPDTPESSMNNSSVLEGDISTIPGTQADENDSCFRRPEIPVRTSISNEHERPKHVPFTLDGFPSSLSNNKDDNDISGVETQRFTVNNTKEMTDNSICNVETQKFVVSEMTIVHSHNNEGCERSLNKSSVKKVLSEELKDHSLEDIETQEFVSAKLNSSSRKSLNISIYSAQTQKVLPDAQENESIENAETQPFSPVISGVDNNLADVSIHSAATQKTVTIVSENKPIEDLETQAFTQHSFSSDKRKSANTSIYSAETQKVIADVSNQSLDDIETQKLDISNSGSKTKSADVSIYSAATQKIAKDEDIENLETQKFESSKASVTSGSHQISKEDKMTLSFSIQDIDTMPFTNHELSFDGKSNVDVQNKDDDLLGSAASTAKSENDKEVEDSENSKSHEQIPTPSEKSDEPHTADEINENIIQNQKQANEMLSKSMSKSLLHSSTTYDKSKSLVESDNEEEIFSQNLIENCPFRLLLDDSKNDDSKNEQSTADLQNDKELDVDRTVDNDQRAPSSNEDNSTANEDLVKNKSTENDDSETDEEGVFSSNSFKEKENEKSPKETGNDSETDEEGVFSNHLTEEEEEKSNIKPKSDSETDEEGVFSDNLSKDSKKRKSTNKSRIINESESEDESVFSNNKASKDSVGPNENVTKAAGNSSFVYKSIKTIGSSSPKMEHSLNKVNEIIQAESPIPESDDDIFNENDEEKRTSCSGSDKVATDRDNVDLLQKSTLDTTHSEVGKNDNDNNDVDELAPTQIVETEDLSLAPTQIINTKRASIWEEDRSEEVDECAPTQLLETQNVHNEEKRSDEIDELAPTQLIETQNLPDVAAAVTDSVKKVAQPYDDMDVAPTQKIIETQDCTESLAPTQKVVDTQVFSEEMGALQFSESLGPTQIIETEPNNVENEVVASPKTSPKMSKRQFEEIKITSNKKQKTSDDSPKVDVDLNSTVEQNLNEMFEGSEVKATNIEEPMETQQLESILESSQIEESPATNLDVSVSKPSPTLSNKRSNIRGKNRRRTLALNKSSALNETPKSVANLNNTIEQNLNELFNNTVNNVETPEPEPEPMLTQQLENILTPSQDSSPIESKKEEEERSLNVSRRKSILSLSSKSLNNSMAKIQNDEEKSKSVQSISQEQTTSRGSLNNEKSLQNEDYTANLEKDNTISEKITTENDKAIVYRRGTIGFTDSLQPVSTFDRVPFLDKYSSTSDSQSDGDDIFKLRQSPNSPSSKKRVNLRLKSVDLNTSLTSSTSVQDVEKKKNKSPVLSSKKATPAHHRSAKKRIPVVRLSKLSSPLYRKYAQPVKRVMSFGTIGFLKDTLEPVESQEMVSAASTESEDDLEAKAGLSNTVNRVEDKSEKSSTDSPMINDNSATKSEQLPIGSLIEEDNDDTNSKQLPTDSPVEEDKDVAKDENRSPDSPLKDEKDDDSGDDFFKDLPVAQIAGTVNCPATSSQIAVPSDHETDSESIKSLKIEISDHWKWYSQKRFDVIYDKCKGKKRADDSGSESGEDKEINQNNISNDSVKDDLENRRAAINKILEQQGLGKDEKKRASNRGIQNDSSKENAVTTRNTRSRKLRKSKTPSPKPAEHSGPESDKTNPALSSSSDSESSDELSILPKYKPLSQLEFDISLLTKKLEDDDDFKKEFDPPRVSQMFKRTQAKPSPLNARRGRKSACNNDVNDVTQYENNADNKKLGTLINGTVVKDCLVFQGSRDSKTTSKASSSATNNRTKRIMDGDEDDESTHQPSPKRTKTLVNRQKLQQATVVISPLKDKLIKLREANRLNVIVNEPSNFKQPESTQANKRSTRAHKTLDNYVVVSKTSRTDSSDMSAVESSIVENKSQSESKSKIKSKPAARTRKAKVVTSSEQSANSSKENLEESDVQKPKTRGRGRRNQTTDSSVSEKESSRDEIPASDVENKSTRSTRGRIVRQNLTKREEEKATIKDQEVIQDSDSNKSQTSKITVRKNTRDRSAKTAEKTNSSKTDAVADNKNDKIQDKKDSESQSSSQSELVTTRTTRTRKNKVNQESSSESSETCDVATARESKRKPANNKSDIVVKLTDVDSNKETMIKGDETKDEVNVFKLMKKKMNVKRDEPSTPPARKTRTRAAKNAITVEQSSSEESQEASEIMKNSVLEDSKTTTKRRGRATKTNSSYVENTESSDDVFEKPTLKPKRARLTKADKNKSSHVSDTDEEPTQSSQRSTRKKHSPSPTLPPDAALALTPSRSSRLSMSSPTRRPKVLFTGEKSEAHRQILTKLGGVVTEEVNGCSVLITDKVRRTFKFLCSLAQGIPIASVNWLDESKKANHFLDLEEYILNDPEAEAKFKFNLKESLDKARKHKLFEGYSIVLSSKIKQPPISELKEMIISSGGKPLVRAPAKWPEKSVVVTAEQELDSAKKLIAKAPKSVTIQSVEFILTGILRQNINLNEFKLKY